MGWAEELISTFPASLHLRPWKTAVQTKRSVWVRPRV